MIRRVFASALLSLLALLAVRPETAQAADAQAAQPPISLGVIVDASDALPLGARVRSAVRSLLEHDPLVTVHALDLGVRSEPGPLALADSALQRTDKLFREMDLEPAKASLEQAQKLYEENLVELVRRDGSAKALRDAQIILGKIRFFEGNFEGAKDALRRAFALDPKLTYSAQLFPVQMKRLAVEARLLFDTLGFAKVDVMSEPAGAAIFLNGQRLAVVTPAAFEAPCGPNSIELQLLAHQSDRQIIEVAAVGGAEAKMNGRLARDQGPPARAREASSLLGKAEVGSTLAVDLGPVATALDAEALLIVHVAASSTMRFTLSGTVYRRGPRHGKAKEGAWQYEPRVERAGATPALEGEVEALVRGLVEPLHERPKQRVAANEPTGDSGWQRFRRSKAFWWVMGGVAGAVVLAGTGVGLGVGLSEAHRHEVARETVLLGGH